jgi:cytochrome P450
VTRYDDVVAVLQDSERFSARGTIAMPAEELPAVRAQLDGRPYPFEVPGLVNNDPPAHTRMRALVRRAFPPKRLTAFEPRIEALADALIDTIADAGRADLVEDFALPLSIGSLAAVMELPDDAVDRVRHWTEIGIEAAQPDLTPARRAECVAAVAEWQAYCLALVGERRAQPGDDLVSGLVYARVEGQPPLDDDEAVAILIQLLIAGFVTTADFIGVAVRLLLAEPARWAALRDDPAPASRVVEEALRLASPLMLATRTTTTAVRIGGCPVPEGARLRLMLGAANRDESRFHDPDSFDPEREDGRRHVAFGIGPHACVGAALARRESRIALERLASRLPGLRLATDERPSYRRSVVFRGLESLDVEWETRRSPSGSY